MRESDEQGRFFVAFGPLAVSAFYRAMLPAGAAGAATGACAVCALLVGLTTTSILLCSHFHQEAGDRAIGKLSPVVRLGTANAFAALAALVAMCYASCAAAACLGILAPFPTLLALLASAPSAVGLLRFVGAHHADPSTVFRAKFYAVKWHATFGFALAASLAVPALAL